MMKMQTNIRRATELTVCMTVIATLLSACGGGGGAAVAIPAASTIFNVTPALGKFQRGATVIIKDHKGAECGRSTTTASGVAAVIINTSTCVPPLIVEAGIKGDKYYDEGKNALVTIAVSGINAVLPDATRLDIGVTALTHIAAAGLMTASGVIATAANVTAQNNSIAALISKGNVTDPLTVPQAADVGVAATNVYGAILATLANLATPTTDAFKVAQSLADDLADGTWDGKDRAGVAVPNAIAGGAAFGTAMVAATAAASASINTATAPTLSFANYAPTSGVAALIASTATNAGIAPLASLTTPATATTATPATTLTAAQAAAVAVASAAAAATPVVLPPSATALTTAKNLFTSLRTSLNLLTNPTQTAFFDTQKIAAKTDLRNSVMPKLNNTMAKVHVLSSAVNMLDYLKANGLVGMSNMSTMTWTASPYYMTFLDASGVPVVSGVPAMVINASGVPVASGVLPTTVATTAQVAYSNYDPKVNASTNCQTTVPANFVAGSLPAGIVVTCNAAIDNGGYVYTATTYTSHTFNATVTPSATANNYSYTSWSVTQSMNMNMNMYMYMLVPPTPIPPIVSANYTGTATVVKAGIQNASIAVTGQLAANGVTHDYDQVVMNSVRTYPFGTSPVGSPAGFALAKYDATGSITSMLANGTTQGTIALLAGSSLSQLEDVNGITPATPAMRYLGKTMTAVLQAKATSTQIDGTLIESNMACDLSGFYCNPTNLSFTGSITNLANPAVGKFFTGTLTDVRDFSSYDVTQLPTYFGYPYYMGNFPVLPNTILAATGMQNRIRDKGTFSGMVTNNTVAPAAVYQVSANEDRTVDNQHTVAIIYSDAANNTVTLNTVVLANTPTHNLNVTSGAVIAVLSRTPVLGGTGGTNGLAGNVYVGSVAPANVIGVIAGNKITYSDGTFASLQ